MAAAILVPTREGWWATIYEAACAAVEGTDSRVLADISEIKGFDKVVIVMGACEGSQNISVNTAYTRLKNSGMQIIVLNDLPSNIPGEVLLTPGSLPEQIRKVL